MLFEQYPPQNLLTPSINDGGVNKLKSSLTSLDFYLLDDIDAYLSPIHSNANTNDLNNDSLNEKSQHQDDFFPDFDFSDINNLEEKSGKIISRILHLNPTNLPIDFIPLDELELEKWITQSSFPSPPMDTNSSPLSQIEDASSTLSWLGEEYPINTDMIVPLSPPLSASSSSSASSIKKTKLSPVERRLRKKGQNKTAAEKYRIKKKSERNQLLDRHSKLQGINKELKSELENLTYRVQQFKQLFNDFVQTN